MVKSEDSLIYRIKQSLKTRWTLFLDWLDVAFGRRHVLAPPKRYDYINKGENEIIAQEFFNIFIEYGNLKPSHQVLEVGSGFGRMAIPLTTYLSKEGNYQGLEIIKDGVNWCQSKFTPKYPNFNFQQIDVYNARYNPGGQTKGSDYRFPFEDNRFDFVFLTSVFTHMFPEDVENYLREISRVLKFRGRCIATYFLLTEKALTSIEKNNSRFTFQHQYKNCFIEDNNRSEYAIAFKETFIERIYFDCSMTIVEPII